MFDPELPRFFRNALINALPNFTPPRHAVESGQLFSKLHALHHSRPRRNVLRGRRWCAAIVRHQNPPKFSKHQPYCNFGEFPRDAYSLPHAYRGNLTAFVQSRAASPAAHALPRASKLFQFRVFSWTRLNSNSQSPAPRRSLCPTSTQFFGTSAAAFSPIVGTPPAAQKRRKRSNPPVP